MRNNQKVRYGLHENKNMYFVTLVYMTVEKIETGLV